MATLVLLLIPAYVQLLLALARLGRVENLAGYLKETGAAFVTGQVTLSSCWRSCLTRR